MEEQKEIIEIINNTINKYPELRFCQILTGLRVLEFANKEAPETSNYNLRDVFSDSDNNVLKRIKTSDLYLKNFI
jgi:hypothetical protein